MKPITRHIKLIQGATFNETYRLFLDLAKTQRYDLSLFGVRMQIRDQQNHSGNLIWDSTSAPSGSSLTVSDAPNGEINLTFSAAVINGFTPGNYFYDLEVYLLTAPTVTVFRLFQGKVQLLNDNVTS